jgi:hypothetical protein
MRKRFLTRELMVAAILLALNAGLVAYFLGFESTAEAGPPPIQYETDLPGGCSNQIDDDDDGVTDCGDPDCIGDPACTAPAPALGPAGLVIGALLLLGVGAGGLAMRRREQE